MTIGIPAFNASKYLHDCVRSVLNQTFINFELIITNDGSSDNTLEIINSFKDRRIKIIADTRNMGISDRINQQVDMARGAYFCRMDADDIMFVSRLQVQIEFMVSNPEVDVIGSQAVVIDEKNSIIGNRFCNPDFSRRSIIREILFIHPTILGKTSWFKKNRYDGKFNGAEDFILWNRSFKISRFHILEVPLLFYRDPGTICPHKYSFRQSQMRMAYMSLYREGFFSFYAVILLVLSSLTKALIFWLFSVIGLQGFLVRKRNQPIENARLDKFKNEMNMAIGSDTITLA